MMKNGLQSIVQKLMNDPAAEPFAAVVTKEKSVILEHAKRKLDFSPSSCDNRTCAVVVNDIRKHPWWGPKVRQLSGEAAAIIMPKILKKPAEPQIDFKKLLARVESDAFPGVLDFFLEVKSLINSAKEVAPEKKQALYDAYVKILMEVFPWFDSNLPWKFFEDATNIPKIPYDDHQYITRNHTIGPEGAMMASPISKQKRLDTRLCQFCGQYGDRSPEAAGRLIHFKYSDWVHVNCALWSSEVYEEIDGSLQNVGQALNRGSKLNCTICSKKGATIGCCHEYCKENVHFECGRFHSSGSSFKEDKTVYCMSHKRFYYGVPEQTNFKSARTIHVEVESDAKKKSSAKTVDLRHVQVLIGSLVVEALSDWNNSEMVDFCEDTLIPMGFRCSRWFWSTLDPTKRVKYTCSVVKSAKKPNIANATAASAEVAIDHSALDSLEAEAEIKKAMLALRKIEIQKAKKTCSNVLPPYAVSTVWNTLKYSDLHKDHETNEDDRKRPRYTIIRQSSNEQGKSRSNPESLTSSPTPKSLNKAVSNVLLKRTPSKILEDGSDLLAAFSRDFPGSDLIDSILREESKRDPNIDVVQTWFNQRKKVRVTEIAIQVNLPFTQTNMEIDELYERKQLEEAYEYDESDEDFDMEADPTTDILSYVVDELSKQKDMDILNRILDHENNPEDDSNQENNNDFMCLSNETSPDKLHQLPDPIESIPQFDGTGDDIQVKEESSPRKDFSIAGLLSPPNPGIVPQIQAPPQIQIQTQIQVQSQIQVARRPSDDDVVFLATSGPTLVQQPPFGLHPQMQPQLTPQPPPVYVQHVANPGMASNFAQSFHQQTGRTLHYVTSIPYHQPTFQYQNLFQPQPQLSYLTPQGIIINQTPQPLFTPGAFQSPMSYFGSPSQFVPSTMSAPMTSMASMSSMSSMASSSQQQQQPRKIARVQPQPQSLKPSDQKMDPIKAMQSMASQPMTSTGQDSLSISHASLHESSNIDVTCVDSENKQRSVGTQAKIGAPLKIITPRPWKSSTSTGSVTPTMTTEPKPVSTPQPMTTAKAIEEEHSYWCPRSPDVNDDALVVDDKVVDKIRVKTKLSSKNAIKIVMQKNLYNDEYKIQAMTIEDGSKNPDAIAPKQALSALKAKTKRKLKPKTKEPTILVPLGQDGQIQHSVDQFVNEVLPDDQLPKPNVKIEPNDDDNEEDAEDDQIIYELTSEDGGFQASSHDINKLWLQVFEAVQEARLLHGFTPIPSKNPIGKIGLQMLGLTHAAVSYLIEQLPGAKEATNYKFKHHFQSEATETEKLKENPSGCARGEAFKDRKPLDMFSWLASRHRKRPDFYCSGLNPETEVQVAAARRATSLDLPMAMRFRHLAKNAKEAVGVYSSGIHGRGLFCKREIQSGEMVIEYAGEEIRAVLTDKREKYYEGRGIGCYMFKIDDDTVVDATMKGNAARFINHSCDPNCYSKIVDIFGKKHIIIFASRKILPGEELTYDYKFPIEDVKIPCSCSARRCRKYMN